MPRRPERRSHSPIAVVVDDSAACLGNVTQAAKEAARRHLPLELLPATPITPTTWPERARHLQRMDIALATARKAVPGLEVRLPGEIACLCEVRNPGEHTPNTDGVE